MIRQNKTKKVYGGSAKFFGGALCAEKIGNELERRLAEDAGRDITVEAVIGREARVRGLVRAKENGVLAGLKEVAAFYRRHELKVKPLKKDGCRLRKGDVIAVVSGPEDAFLATERTGLNMLQRMSGIATAARKLADIAGRYGVAVAGTRKTLLLYPDKKAIWLGGGLPHRLSLGDAILVKDNHLSAIADAGENDPLTVAVGRACGRAWRLKAKFAEIEAPDRAAAVKAAEVYAKKIPAWISRPPFIIMLDNMEPADIRKTVRELKKKNLYEAVLLEASGNIGPDNLAAYAKTGIDAVSVGWLTHSARALDINQKITARKI